MASTIPFTQEQRKAVETTGQSVIVSAAAGSGKTAVLAERCAFLVCDASPEYRCDVEQLLVLTFTEAAAAEMRHRIVQAIRRRVGERPDDHRLQEQLALIDGAHISTIHAFCLWMIRRWFNETGLDPSAAVLDEQEARLMKRDVLDGLFKRRYEASCPRSAFRHPLYRTTPSSESKPERGSETIARRSTSTTLRNPSPISTPDRFGLTKTHDTKWVRDFIRLVDDYGLGDDRPVIDFVLKLSDFLDSQPDPERWLDEAVRQLGDRPDLLLRSWMSELRQELIRQQEHTAQWASSLERAHPVVHFYGGRIRQYADQLDAWRKRLDVALSLNDTDETLRQFETIRGAIADHAFGKETGPRLPKDAPDEERTARDRASKCYSTLKKNWFGERLRDPFALFGAEEAVAALRETAPYVSTLCRLTLDFRRAYARKKRELNVMDFADQERFAFDLLCEGGDVDRPTAIARFLQQRFVQTLVDEFQDINPLQQAIITLVSRESDPDARNNLFVVGDVKQSIYRFRLAEPALFIERLTRFQKSTGTGQALFLQRNFRSRPEILSAVNLLFSSLMRSGVGDVVYDDAAQLLPGLPPPAGPVTPVELHLLEKQVDPKFTPPDESDDDSMIASTGAARDPSRWTAIEREAYLIASRIQDILGDGPGGNDDRKLQYRDVVVLLRTKRISAERVASMLSTRGIPAHADMGGSLFAAREVREVVAALQLFDNVQQDIPLAGVLRSGILGTAFTEDDLVDIRCLDRRIPFHAVVRQYAQRGGDPDLRDRLAAWLATLDRFRTDARRRPLSDTLRKLYDEHGYLAFASGLKHGEQRRANLLKLHELSRRFGTFQHQGLHRFLRFIDALAESREEVATAAAFSEAEDVVRVMSIHQSKGLEFPVVFLAGLGTKFNLGDRQGRMIFERQSKIGLRVVDPMRMIEVPTIAHRLVAAEVERTTREEELRILYVAMTRAKERLILIGSCRDVEQKAAMLDQEAEPQPPSAFTITTALTPLDWIVPILSTAKREQVQRHDQPMGDKCLFTHRVHTRDDITAWSVSPPEDETTTAVQRAAACAKALPADEPLSEDSEAVQTIVARLDFLYPYLSSTSVPASVAAGEFKGAYDFLHDPEVQRPPQPDRQVGHPSRTRGLATHRVLEHLDFNVAVDGAGVSAELARLTGEGILTAEESSLIDRDSLAWFGSTELAQRIRRAGCDYRREFMFLTTEPLTFVDRSIESPPDDRVLVKGVVDGILPVGEGLEVIDFKTDAIKDNEVSDRAMRYHPQLLAYRRAVSRLWRRPVRTCWLVFLAPRVCHAVQVPQD